MATEPATDPHPLAAELAPGGTLRAAINLGNPVLAHGDEAVPRELEHAQVVRGAEGTAVLVHHLGASGFVAAVLQRAGQDPALAVGAPAYGPAT